MALQPARKTANSWARDAASGDKMTGPTKRFLVPSFHWNEMFIERRGISNRFFLAPWERNVLDFPIISGNIALRWSAGRGYSGSINIWLLWSQALLATS